MRKVPCKSSRAVELNDVKNLNIIIKSLSWVFMDFLSSSNSDLSHGSWSECSHSKFHSCDSHMRTYVQDILQYCD